MQRRISKRSIAEKLEITVVFTFYSSVSVDVPADYWEKEGTG